MILIEEMLTHATMTFITSTVAVILRNLLDFQNKSLKSLMLQNTRVLGDVVVSYMDGSQGRWSCHGSF